jgi:hypothetical protein
MLNVDQKNIIREPFNVFQSKIFNVVQKVNITDISTRIDALTLSFLLLINTKILNNKIIIVVGM